MYRATKTSILLEYENSYGAKVGVSVKLLSISTSTTPINGISDDFNVS